MSSIVNGFTQVQKEEYKKYFDQFDQGQKNYLTNDEMNNLLEYLGLSTYRELFNNFDMITYNNYLSILQKKLERQKLEEEIIKAFEFFDKDKKGYFEIDFFKSLMLSLKEKLTIEEVNEMIKEADPCSLGYIKYKEFVKLLLKNTDTNISDILKCVLE